MNKRLITGICCFFLFTAVMAQRTEVLLERAGSSSGEIYPELLIRDMTMSNGRR